MTDFTKNRKFLTIKARSKNQLLSFSILSYNILAQTLICREQYPYASKQALKKKFRRRNILTELEYYNCDILCIQELDEYYSFWNRELNNLGYDSDYITGLKKKKNNIHGCAIFWKRNLFKKIRSKHIMYIDMANDYTDENIIREMKSDQVAQLIALSTNKTENGSNPEEAIIIANTHLLWNPLYSFVRLRQIEMLMKSIHTLNQDLKYPVILCGDFNTYPRHILYRFMTQRLIEENHLKTFLTPRLHFELEHIKIGSLPSNLTNDVLQTLHTPLEDNHNVIRLAEAKSIIDKMKNLELYPLLKSVYGNYKQALFKGNISNGELIDVLGENDCGEPDFTNFVKGFEETLDYIFILDNKFSNLQCNKLLSIPTREIVTRQIALPNDHFSSDHICLVAEIEILK